MSVGNRAMEDVAFLYVEDDELSRQIMRTILQRVMGYTKVFSFENSEHFSDRLRALPIKPTVIFLDIHMQPVSGFELLQLIRAESGYQETKVIAVTASVMNEEMDKLKQSGFDGAVSKPLSLETFPTLILQILNGETVWYVA
jgi:CheY-like chemotaxis protein